MLVTVFCAPRDRPESTFALDVSPELELRDFVALCELESGIPAGEIQISYVEQPLKDPTRALGTYGVKDGDVVVLRQADRRPPPTQPAFPGLPHIDFRSITVPGASTSTAPRSTVRPPQQQAAPPALQQQQQQQMPPQQQPELSTQPSTINPPAVRGSSSQGLDDPALLQQMLLSNPHELSLLKERNPPLAEALLSGDLERFTKVLLEQQQDRAKREQERIRLLTADPFDLEAQAKIEEDIRQHNVEENMTIAMEEAPESFGQVVMLYINCKVNGHPVKAFVDSGAQMTIMSQACADRCNIMRLVDRRWAGIAKGVGTQKIIGRVHLAQVQIEGDFLPCSFSILEDQPMDMLLGLDMLKRHQCSIDLKKSVLVIGTTGTETRFLSEAELPECARLAYGPEGREAARPEEMADRELAEALQRSIHESDTADGQTTSPQPPPLSLPTAADQMSSSAHPHKADSDCSESTLELTSGSDQLGLQEPHLPIEQDQLQPPPLEDCTVSVEEAPGPCQSAEALHCPEGNENGTTEASQTENSPALPYPELAPSQPMEHEAAESGTTHPCQSGSVQMDSSCRDQPESSDSIPSLAAALLELHELLLSNNCSTSHPSTHPQEEEPTRVRAEPSDAKAKPSTACDVSSESAGADSSDGPLEPPSEVRDPNVYHPELVAPLQPPTVARDSSIYHPESPSSPDCDGNFREPLEGHQGSGDAHGRVSTPDSLVSGTTYTPPPITFTEQYPAEHIQRIQAAGFSARDAAEALEQAHGVVELALLALLARSITVPT
ncbi:protein DDI1 homolog 2 isoform X1 [Syngnathus typhle]|uniref:protein DDI1 homolog 2 isoform X1 n=1 Tax=Syngnathus typhle TaxID=161592 RepID=UPI002A6A7E10|nr:protein DDI1 homolog 2 isoform X1 [Syngnathus typhle]XP_061146237.1 protein DDI1 homolog 2 isoform X1 [Syngnathus typhle]